MERVEAVRWRRGGIGLVGDILVGDDRPDGLGVGAIEECAVEVKMDRGGETLLENSGERGASGGEAFRRESLAFDRARAIVERFWGSTSDALDEVLDNRAVSLLLV